MDISRKDFFKKSLFSIGEAITTITGTLKEPEAGRPTIPDTAGFVPAENGDMRAVAHNEHCLARECGCFACFERCAPQAITVVMGQGIRIDEARCTGCGTCEYVCPATPKAVGLQPRNGPESAARDNTPATPGGE